MMLNIKYIKLVPIFIALFCFQSSNAQITKKAQVGFRFLENPVSAEVVGKGGVGIISTLNANGIFWNPALIGEIQSDVDVTLNHTKFIADINYNAAAAAVKVGNFGVIGVSLLAMDYGTFYRTYRSNNSQGYVDAGTFSPTAFAVGLAFSQKVTDRFSYGVHLKYVKQDLGDAMVSTAGDSWDDPKLALQSRNYSSSKFSMPLAIDVGAIYDFKYNGIRFAASMQNISKEFQYESEAFPMPFAVSFGATVEPLGFFDLQDNSSKLVLSIESRHPRDYGEKTKYGAEYTYLNAFTARVGYMSNYDERGWTMGAGVMQEFSGIPIRIDYAYQAFGIFGGVHHVSFGVSY
ncbi:MAG: PorV/PorQ family protein [Bacteroidota bacterium]|nr:PorV/PorQ family protein [Bacteroidota bacterium]MDP4195380.1 PorV/PorQ family protein [Bacteroidota bacterium]